MADQNRTGCCAATRCGAACWIASEVGWPPTSQLTTSTPTPGGHRGTPWLSLRGIGSPPCWMLSVGEAGAEAAQRGSGAANRIPLCRPLQHAVQVPCVSRAGKRASTAINIDVDLPAFLYPNGNAGSPILLATQQHQRGEFAAWPRGLPGSGPHRPQRTWSGCFGTPAW